MHGQRIRASEELFFVSYLIRRGEVGSRGQNTRERAVRDLEPVKISE